MTGGVGTQSQISRTSKCSALQPTVGAQAAKFLELSGVCKVVEAGADKEERRATRLDSWIAWEAEGAAADFGYCTGAVYVLP
jgi:hypothetical protein